MENYFLTGQNYIFPIIKGSNANGEDCLNWVIFMMMMTMQMMVMTISILYDDAACSEAALWQEQLWQ